LDRKIKDFSTYVSKFISDERLDLIARQTGFVQRKSPITPSAFLNAVFFSNARSCPTLTDYSIGLGQTMNRPISKQAVDKRFNENTKSMLVRLMEEILKIQICRKSVFDCPHFSEIRIMDSTEFTVTKKVADVFPGYGGTGREAIVQIQLEFELLGGKITELSLGSARDADSIEGMKNLDKIPAKSLLIRDLGYFSPKSLLKISKHNLYFISRAKTQWSMYESTTGKLEKISIEDIKNRLAKSKDKIIELDVLIGEQSLAPVRFIASKLTKSQTEQRIKRLRANRGKLSQKAIESAGLNLFVTNIEREIYPADQVYKLYSLRWQIELVFKTWKSILKLHNVHSMNAIRLECTLLIKLIWVMLNWSILRLFEEILSCELSLTKLTRTILNYSGNLNLRIFQRCGPLIDWLQNMCSLSRSHHLKEYKKGRIRIQEILT
jgi:hypothetical protein